MKVTFLGSGNLATRLALAMQEAGGFEFVQVFSRTAENAAALARQLSCAYTSDASQVTPEADLYVFSLKDTVLEEVVASIPANSGLWVHTAGSMPMEIFAPYTKRYGVCYPLQTFSKQRKVDFREIPFFLEAAHEADALILQALASRLSDQVRFLSSEKRRHLHLAAVFACNFVNHIYALAGNILEAEAIPFEVLLPLIDETAAKVHELEPRRAQTGPAVRYDENVIRKHLSMLQDPQMQDLYQRLSQSIYQEAQKK